MSTNTINQSAFLRSTRQFPTDSDKLSQELDKSYLDISNAVNVRTIGLFPTTKPALTGEEWYFDNNVNHKGLRQLYNISGTTSINHNIDITNITFTKCSGSFTDGTNWYNLLFGSNVSISGQISFYITSTQVVFLSGLGAPSLTSGLIVLEWISNL